MRLRQLGRRLRRFHRFLSVFLMALYTVSGLTILIGMESPRIQGWIHIAIGIIHGLA
jgi:hypothetical protein